MEFERITPEDLPAIKKLQPEDWGDIIPDMEFYLRYPFCNPVKAILDGQIVGIGTSIIFDQTAWLAHIIVGSSFRNKGIGGKVVNYLMESLHEDSVDTCLLIATELGKPVYVKAGFNVVCEYLFFERKEPWIECPVSENIVLFHEDYRINIYEMDKKMTGENRIPLLTDYLKNALLYLDNDSLLGYYIPDLKEGLIVAETHKAGLELMTLKYSKADRAVLPSTNLVGCQFLLQHGFIKTKTGTRMVHGKNIVWKPEMLFSRIGGNLG